MLNDGLPNQICMQCVQYINKAYSFRQLCERSENALRELLGRPIQQTFLELKPLLATETLITHPIPEIIAGVTESFQTPMTLSDNFAITQNINTLTTNLSDTTETISSVSENVNNVSKNINTTERIINRGNFNNESLSVGNSTEISSINLQQNFPAKLPICSLETTSEESKIDKKNIELSAPEKYGNNDIEDDSCKYNYMFILI